MKKQHIPNNSIRKPTARAEKYKNLEIPLLPLEKKFELLIGDFIKSVFNHSNIRVQLKKISQHPKKRRAGSTNELLEKKGHLCFQFFSAKYKKHYYYFRIENIPAHSTSFHIRIFFEVLKEYISDAYANIQKNLHLQSGEPAAVTTQLSKSDIWLYNIEQIIIIQFLFKLFNNISDSKPINSGTEQKPYKYDLDLINTIYSFSLELTRKKIESKDINCGFVFFDNEDEIKAGSVRRIAFQEKVNFGKIELIKDFLTTSDGEKTFFNVASNKITHLFVIENALTELGVSKVEAEDKVAVEPLVLSIQDNSKIYFMKGYSGFQNIVFQIFNSNPLIRDYNFIENYISNKLKAFADSNSNRVQFLSKWILSTSLRRHGTSFIFLNITTEIENKLVKFVKIKPDKKLLLEPEIEKFDFILLDSIVNTDGAVIFNSSLIPTHISTILPIVNSGSDTLGGARHNSLSNFTKMFNCLGIVISEDGPISIFNNGKLLIKF